MWIWTRGSRRTLDDLYEQLDNARVQMLGENYTRMLINLNLPEEGAETFAFLQTIHREAERYYDADSVYLVGDSTSDYDLSVSFARDNIMISVLSVVFVIIVLLFTFQSVGLPILLILVLQGSIWDQFFLPRHGPEAHFLPELSDRDSHPDGRQYRLRHRDLLLVQ